MKKALLSLVFLLAVGYGRASEPALVFNVAEYDFGRVPEGRNNEVSYDFILRNAGDSPLVLTRIITSCKCVTTSYTRKPIPPGGEGVVSVTYDPKKQQGVFYKAVQVFSNAPEGIHIIVIKGEVVRNPG
ncbi:MAG: DUF1573 domain-containing protein [Rikenellaceae bacterium]|nr:DUF1573 domain-containing protein [Rikenellaceae bacterium]